MRDLSDILVELRAGSDVLADVVAKLFGEDWQSTLGEPIESSSENFSELGLETTGLVVQYGADAQPDIFLCLPAGVIQQEWLSDAEEENEDKTDSQYGKLLEFLAAIGSLFGIEKAPEFIWTPEMESEVRLRSDVSSFAGLQIDTFSENDPEKGQPLLLIAGIATAESESNSELDEDPYNLLEGIEDSYPESESEEPVPEPQAPAIDPNDIINRIRRVLPLTVEVSVRVAEKKIDLSQLVNLCPGTLIVFQKSCDDLLDLYVNNLIFAQGEAVKIGEKFGLKINEVGVEEHREPGVFSL